MRGVFGMALYPYCSNDEVRSVLGVSKLELGDEKLDLPVYNIGLQEALLDLSPTLLAVFSTANETPETDRPRRQVALINAVHLFSVYSKARQVGSALGMFTPKTLSDEKASYSRFAGEPYKDTLEEIDKQLAKYTAKVIDTMKAFDVPQGTVKTPVRFVAAKRRYDPVTGESV